MAAIVTDDSQEMAPTNVPDPLLTVVIEAYNHEDYIERCLRSIAMQRVSFPIEVLVGEDGSPDGTADVLRRIAPDMPDSFTFILRRENLGATGNGRDLWRRARGKYCAFIEGDDFWTDEDKLQTQVDFLEANPDFSAVYAKVYVVGEDSKPNGESYPQCDLPEYTPREFFYSMPPGHWSTLVCDWTRFYPAYRQFITQENYANYAGDRRNAFILLTQGKIRCLDRVTGAYRHIKHKGTSFSARVRIDEDYANRELLYGRSLVDFAQAKNRPDLERVAKRTYYRFLLKWSVGKVKVRKLGDSLSEIMRQPGRLSYLTAPLQWYSVLALRKLRGRSVDL